MIQLWDPLRCHILAFKENATQGQGSHGVGANPSMGQESNCTFPFLIMDLEAVLHEPGHPWTILGQLNIWVT